VFIQTFSLLNQRKLSGYLNITNPMKITDQDIMFDRSACSIATREEAQRQDNAFWQLKTPEERLEALESLKQTTYGYNPAI
jgi:hypothetical protein